MGGGDFLAVCASECSFLSVFPVAGASGVSFRGLDGTGGVFVMTGVGVGMAVLALEGSDLELVLTLVAATCFFSVISTEGLGFSEASAADGVAGSSFVATTAISSAISMGGWTTGATRVD